MIIDASNLNALQLEMNVTEALNLIERLARLVNEKHVGLPIALHRVGCITNTGKKNVPSCITFHVVEK